MLSEQVELSDKQEEAWHLLDDPGIVEVFAGGGAGGGKSLLGCTRQIYRRLKYPGTRGLIGRESYTGLRDSTMNTYFALVQAMGYRSGEHYTYNAQEHTVFWANGSEQHFRHMAYMPSDPDYNRFGSTEYTDALALRALKSIFEYLPRAYDNGPNDPVAREKMGNAATMAGMAFANAFLGVCHSMAHKLGAFHHLPHGVANALMIEQVLRFNAEETPKKMGTFSQYAYPHTMARYAEVADYLGLKGKDDKDKLEALIKAVNDLKERVGIKKTIKEYGIDEGQFLKTIDEMTEQAFDDQCTGANPRYPLMSEIKEMYLKAYYGK